jgi:predicted NUDIX family NTP pyrophosphohydrolase
VAKRSAGLLPYHVRDGEVHVLLVHPGGPFWRNKDDGAWSIPKGEHTVDDGPLAVAEREFAEELGVAPPAGEREPLGEIAQSGGKRVTAWAVRGDVDVSEIASNEFEMEWPPRSGRMQRFPEVDRAAWVPVTEARTKLLPGQVPLLDRLLERLG